MFGLTHDVGGKYKGKILIRMSDILVTECNSSRSWRNSSDICPVLSENVQDDPLHYQGCSLRLSPKQ